MYALPFQTYAPLLQPAQYMDVQTCFQTEGASTGLARRSGVERAGQTPTLNATAFLLFRHLCSIGLSAATERHSPFPV